MRFCTVLVFGLLAASRPALAQDIVPMLDSIGRGCCTLRVKSPQGTAEGKFLDRPSPSRLLLRPCKGNLCPPVESTLTPVEIPPGAEIEMYTGRKVGFGAIWGAIIGAVALSAVWVADKDIDESLGAKVGVGVPIGALIGSGVGALIGALVPRWKPVRY